MWTIDVIGSPARLAAELERFSASLVEPDAKAEFDLAKPALLALVNLNVAAVPLLLQLQASGRATLAVAPGGRGQLLTAASCQVSLQPLMAQVLL